MGPRRQVGRHSLRRLPRTRRRAGGRPAARAGSGLRTRRPPAPRLEGDFFHLRRLHAGPCRRPRSPAEHGRALYRRARMADRALSVHRAARPRRGTPARSARHPQRAPARPGRHNHTLTGAIRTGHPVSRRSHPVAAARCRVRRLVLPAGAGLPAAGCDRPRREGAAQPRQRGEARCVRAAYAVSDRARSRRAPGRPGPIPGTRALSGRVRAAAHPTGRAAESPVHIRPPEEGLKSPPRNTR